ncbi:rhodanese-like domain-containing protein [Candidatus Vallotia cooleyia]|uniref:rhodanese-like domain-containing protein n=1 Tax=Candidatus Vallotiella adelgis TaxID=1177211 RepID=UPI001D0059F6|nr:rhodanese-like domain-containing protein [Candidatus Vallotia cooleyia]UDG82541.1 Thiosulfate sulfurtransferase GlpE [Candidatus Vallotia cooleyia]
MKFFSELVNLVLIAIAFISGALLLWPVWLLRRATLSCAPWEATQLINRHNAIIIDLRSADKFRQGHLPQARHLPFDELRSKVDLLVKNKNTAVLLVCQNSKLSSKAHYILKKAGYVEVFTLRGGMNAWQQSNMPVVKQKESK